VEGSEVRDFERGTLEEGDAGSEWFPQLVEVARLMRALIGRPEQAELAGYHSRRKRRRRRVELMGGEPQTQETEEEEEEETRLVNPRALPTRFLLGPAVYQSYILLQHSVVVDTAHLDAASRDAGAGTIVIPGADSLSVSFAASSRTALGEALRLWPANGHPLADGVVLQGDCARQMWTSVTFPGSSLRWRFPELQIWGFADVAGSHGRPFSPQKMQLVTGEVQSRQLGETARRLRLGVRKRGSDQWQTVYGASAWSKAAGVVWWEVRVDATRSGRIFLGVASLDALHHLNTVKGKGNGDEEGHSHVFAGKDDQSWSWLGTGFAYFDGRRQRMPLPDSVTGRNRALRAGDLVRLTLDLRPDTSSSSIQSNPLLAGTLHIAVNGLALSPTKPPCILAGMRRALPGDDDALTAAISLYDDGDQGLWV